MRRKYQGIKIFTKYQILEEKYWNSTLGKHHFCIWENLESTCWSCILRQLLQLFHHKLLKVHSLSQSCLTFNVKTFANVWLWRESGASRSSDLHLLVVWLPEINCSNDGNKLWQKKSALKLIVRTNSKFPAFIQNTAFKNIPNRISF